jgi:outer membrane protein TolC
MTRLVVTAMSLLMTLGALAQSTISLKECIALAEKHSPQAELLPIIQKATDLQMALLQKNYLPQTALNGQATWQSATTSLPIKLPNLDIEPLSKFQYKGTMDMTQTIWDGGATKAQKNVAKISSVAEETKVKVDLFALREQVSSLFFGVLLAKEQSLNLAWLKKDIDTRLTKTKSLREGGMAIGSNILALEARLIEVEMQLNELNSRQAGARATLALLTGDASLHSKPLEDADIMMLTDTTTILRPELQYLDAQSAALAASEQLIKAKNLPKINAFATGGVGRPSLNFLSNTITPYFIGGIQMRVPLSHFYTNSQSIERQQIAVNRQKIQVQRDNFVWMTKIKAAAQHEDIQRFDSLLEMDYRLIRLREDILKTAAVQLENGIITTNDYLNELTNVDIARQNKALHRVQRLQAIQNLAITLGN